MSLAVQLQSLTLAGRPLLLDLRMDVPAGVVHTVMGRSGCGKSSLLAAICGTLVPPLQFQGSIMLNGRDLTPLPIEQRRVGMLFQDDLLFAHMTVGENLLFAVPPGPRVQRAMQVSDALQDLELPGMANANPATLSGGQRARVALMRALLAQPEALLLDEPFTSLDIGLRERMREYVFSVVQTRQIPVVLVTHDAADIADPNHLTTL